MLQHQIFRTPESGEPLILAAFSYRYDAHLVPDLLENLRGAVHGFVAWDDRSADTALSDEPTRRGRLLSAARDLGATWLLTPDPDERFESGFAQWLPDLIAEGERNLWLFSLREMFTPTHYRTDGLWGVKSVLRLFPIAAAGNGPDRALHGPWAAEDAGYNRRNSRINLYHLRMASPMRRQFRRDLYATADPERRFQKIGYDYLADDRGMQLVELPNGRAFHPPFVEDHGLWAPEPGCPGGVLPDPYAVRVARAAISRRRGGVLAAHHVITDLMQDSPQDHDLRLIAARHALDAAAPGLALPLVEAAAQDQPKNPYPRILRAMACLAADRPEAALADIERLERIAPESPLLAALRADAERPGTDFTASGAEWRDLAPGGNLREGARVALSDLAVIVIGFQNQPGLLWAVQSLLEQEVTPEIVVVNSGGGPVAESLAPVLERIRLLTTDEPLFVGAARNIGVAASRAPFVAFLAADCLARPGWVAGRLHLHRSGSEAVSTAVVGKDGAGLVARCANVTRYATRNPDADPRVISHYGQSYSRQLLRRVGQFPPGLRVAEDTALNRIAARFAVPDWAPSVQTIHRDLTSLQALVADERERGRRRACHPPFRPFADHEDPAAGSDHLFAYRRIVARNLVSQLAGLSGPERRAISAMQWLALQADRGGTLEGLCQIAEANRMMERAAATRSLALAEAARDLDPMDPAKSVLLGNLRRAEKDIAGAMTAFRQALALKPAEAEAARPLVELVSARSGAKAGLQEAERLALAAPTTRQIWEIAATAALASDKAGWAVMLGQVALGLAIDNAALHLFLQKLHLAAGDPLAAAFRGLAARRLKAADLQRRAESNADQGLQGSVL